MEEKVASHATAICARALDIAHLQRLDSIRQRLPARILSAARPRSSVAICASLSASSAANAAPSPASTSTSGIPTADRKLRMVTRSSAENTFRPGSAGGKHSLVQAPFSAERMIHWERSVVVIEDGPATAAAAARRRMLIGIDMLVAGGPPRVLPGPKNEVTGFASAIVFELVLGKPATRA
ncbi:hypothetical protein DFH11DRAFT_247151 [Phellopilus nigrolimitatus]|nr:hypothetical protein DFH11DRAFT_247151 [Phellopilus nigrolimitatus]